MGRRRQALALFPLVLSACASGHTAATTRTSASSVATDTTVTTVLTSTTGQVTTTTTSVPAPLSPADTVALTCDYNAQTILVSLVESVGSFQGRETVNVGALLSGWNIQDTAVGEMCDNRDQWSADFSRLLFTGEPANSSASHIGYIDVTDNKVVDLTQQRQKSDFSSPLLNEASPQFLGAGGSKLNFGSDTILFTDSTGSQLFTTSISSPTTATHLAASPPQHDELLVRAFDPGRANNFDQPSPRGDYLADADTGLIRVRPIGATDWNYPSCQASGYPLGWVDDHHLVVADTASVAVVTITADGKVASCSDPVPATPQSLSGFELSFDRKTLTFSASGAASGLYQVPALGGPATPAQAPAMKYSGNTVFFFPTG